MGFVNFDIILPAALTSEDIFDLRQYMLTRCGGFEDESGKHPLNDGSTFWTFYQNISNAEGGTGVSENLQIINLLSEWTSTGAKWLDSETNEMFEVAIPFLPKTQFALSHSGRKRHGGHPAFARLAADLADRHEGFIYTDWASELLEYLTETSAFSRRSAFKGWSVGDDVDQSAVVALISGPLLRQWTDHPKFYLVE